jgi:carbonic anhydrase
MISANQALERLKAGNLRFSEGKPNPRPPLDADRRLELMAGQAPFATILGCSDSRVPVENVFDQGFGDLFVIRVAGNIVHSSQLASVEFAAERIGTRLVVVLGHSQCGAIQASLDQIQRPSGEPSDSLKKLLDVLRPSVETALADAVSTSSESGPSVAEIDPSAVAYQAVLNNVRNSAQQLRSSSPALCSLIEAGALRVVGAIYCLETGKVDFFDGLAESGQSD